VDPHDPFSTKESRLAKTPQAIYTTEWGCPRSRRDAHGRGLGAFDSNTTSDSSPRSSRSHQGDLQVSLCKSDALLLCVIEVYLLGLKLETARGTGYVAGRSRNDTLLPSELFEKKSFEVLRCPSSPGRFAAPWPPISFGVVALLHNILRCDDDHWDVWPRAIQK